MLSIYEQDGIPMADNEENITQTEIPVYGAGKLGTVYPVQDASMNYELTDHLGNVRALLRDNVNVNTATMEDNGIENANDPFENPRVEEMQYFENLFDTEYTDAFMNVSKATAEEPNPEKVAYLFWNDVAGTTQNEKAVGPSIALKVNAGDELNIEAWTRYENKLTFAKDFDLVALSSLLGNTFVSANGFEGLSSTQRNATLESALTTAAYGKESSDTRPYAYLNYIVYNTEMVYQDAGWVRVPLEAASEQSELYLPENKPVHFGFTKPVTIPQSSYIYIWLSNQSKETRVWFDDLTVTHMQNMVVQATDYGVWGDVLREQKTDESVYRYGYQGQFAEKDEETGWNHFELREYDPIISRWTSKDPYGQYWSPYIGMGNNPITGIDPDGGKRYNPIFDYEGNFLGTDALGLQGEAIFMNAKDFRQGMAHEDALKVGHTFSQVFEAGTHPVVLADVFHILETFPARPDWDGYLTLGEANDWYRNGNGQPLYVDASQINLSPLRASDFQKNGTNNMYYNFATPSAFSRKDPNVGLVYGTMKVTVHQLRFGTVTLGADNGYLDTYDFEYHDGRFLRNVATFIGKNVAGEGTSYRIHSYGLGHVFPVR